MNYIVYMLNHINTDGDYLDAKDVGLFDSNIGCMHSVFKFYL